MMDFAFQMMDFVRPPPPPQETSTNPYDKITLEEVGSAAHETLAREAAIQSM